MHIYSMADSEASLSDTISLLHPVASEIINALNSLGPIIALTHLSSYLIASGVDTSVVDNVEQVVRGIINHKGSNAELR